MYYQRRSDLIAHVEDFYQMYRVIVERYDNVTGELRKNAPSELQSQGFGNGSDFCSEPDSSSLEPIPERRPPRPKPGPRAAGFGLFLGSAGSSDHSRNGSDGSSSSESDSDSDDSKHILERALSTSMCDEVKVVRHHGFCNSYHIIVLRLTETRDCERLCSGCRPSFSTADNFDL